jgi:hypothetical protein
MGGFLAQPAKYYPSVFSHDGIFGRYPYLLPNLVAAIGIFLAIIQGMLFLEETNPGTRGEEDSSAIEEVNERTPFMQRPRQASTVSTLRSGRHRSLSIVEGLRQIRKKPSFMEEGMPMPIDQTFDLRRSSFATIHSITMPRHEILPPPILNTPPRRTFNFTVIMVTLALTLLAYHQMAYVTVLPVYLLDDVRHPGIDFQGGLGLDLHDVGTFLAVNGFIALAIQGGIFPFFVEKVGVWRSFVAMIVLYPTTYLFVPFISALPAVLIDPAVYLSLILQGFFGIIVFPCALILLKNATPSPLVLGRVNGAAMSACCLARTLSSPLVGWIYAEGGSAAAWFSLAFVAFLGTVQLFWVPNELGGGKVRIENGLKEVMNPHHHEHHHPVEQDINESAIED